MELVIAWLFGFILISTIAYIMAVLFGLRENVTAIFKKLYYQITKD